MKAFIRKLDNYFEITKRGSTWVKEIIGGIMVFFAMLYILPVNSSIIGGIDGIPAGAVFAATAICSGICTILMGAYARFPVAQSAGMGMNAYLAYTVCGQLGFDAFEGLAVVIVSGFLFFVFTLTPIRTWVINAIPKSLKFTISAGLGAFICFVGLKMSGIIVDDPATLVAFASFTNIADKAYVLLALGGIVLTFVLLCIPNVYVKRFAILIAMIATAVIGLIMGAAGVTNMPSFKADTGSISDISKVFGRGFEALPRIFAKPATYGVIFSFIMVNLFDTSATLIAIGDQVGIVDHETGHMIGGKKAMIADATGALIAGVFGTSPITSFAESTVGVESGARTGVSAIVTGLLFFLTLAIFPVFNIFAGIPVGTDIVTPCTSLALVAVGAMMFGNLRHVEWDNKIDVFASFLTFILMILTYSITNGIALGIIFYAVMCLASGRFKTTSPVIWCLTVLFIVMFVVDAVVKQPDTQAITNSVLALKEQLAIRS